MQIHLFFDPNTQHVLAPISSMLLSCGTRISRDIQMLESVQKFACKVCLKCWNMDYDNMLHCLDLPFLRVRRQHLKLITMFNIIWKQFFQHYLQFIWYLSQKNNLSVFFRPYSRTKHLYFHMYLMSLMFGILYK